MSLDLAPIIAQHGHAVLSVLTDHPAVPAWSYTVGRARQGRPELVVFDLHERAAGEVLNELVRRDGAGELHAGAAVDLWPGAASVDVRLGRVRPEHVDRWLPAAVQAAGTRLVDALQVGLPDADGRLSDDALTGCECCPDLTRQGRPWTGPYDPRAVSFRRDADSPELDVCVPVIQLGDQQDRVEVVPCKPLGERMVEVLDPPVLADWVTAGAVLEVAEEPDPSGLPLATVQLRPSPLVHLTWRIRRCAITDAGAEGRLCAALDRVAEVPDVAVTWADDWLAVASLPAHAERVRSRMRHLVRDGLAMETRPFSSPDSLGIDPRCAACDLP